MDGSVLSHLMETFRGQMRGAGFFQPSAPSLAWLEQKRGFFCNPPATPMLGGVTVSSMDPSAHGWIWGLIPSFGLFILAVQETAFVRAVSAWEQCPQGPCSWPRTSRSYLCWENPQREEINNPGRMKSGWLGCKGYGTSSHPISSAPYMYDGFLLLRGFLPLKPHLQAHSKQQQSKAERMVGFIRSCRIRPFPSCSVLYSSCGDECSLLTL